MHSLIVDLGDRSYPIHLGNFFEQGDLLIKTITHHEVAIVTNETIAPLYLEKITRLFSLADRKVIHVILPDGEQHKSLDTVNIILTSLLEHQMSRKSALIALGGGVVGDMTGFAASIYQRGIDFIQIPTTLLSQVDSSVGGKTGVNHALGKNMIGAFKQPLAVFIDPSSLRTLPKRELIAGFAEVIKHALIQDKSYFDWLKRNLDEIFALDFDVIVDLIIRSCEIKSKVVAMDETEQGIRATLNFGHTFGHAIETTLGYGDWLHGEAVGFGMKIAADFSYELGLLSQQDLREIHSFLVSAQLPQALPSGIKHQDFMSSMYRDKKVDSGVLKLVLLTGIGQCVVTDEFDPVKLEAFIARYM